MSEHDRVSRLAVVVLRMTRTEPEGATPVSFGRKSFANVCLLVHNVVVPRVSKSLNEWTSSVLQHRRDALKQASLRAGHVVTGGNSVDSIFPSVTFKIALLLGRPDSVQL